MVRIQALKVLTHYPSVWLALLVNTVLLGKRLQRDLAPQDTFVCHKQRRALQLTTSREVFVLAACTALKALRHHNRAQLAHLVHPLALLLSHNAHRALLGSTVTAQDSLPPISYVLLVSTAQVEL